MNISNIKQLIYNGIIKNYWLYPSKQIRLLVKKGFKQSLKGEKSINVIENYPIDLVVTWVDESDLNWQSEKRKYEADIKKEIDTDNLVERYRDWNILRFWFRSVEKYAPWIRKVFFVTYGHLPEWINLNNEKLVVVKHEDFIPQEYLPTFSCRPIELNLWRIKLQPFGKPVQQLRLVPQHCQDILYIDFVNLIPRHLFSRKAQILSIQIARQTLKHKNELRNAAIWDCRLHTSKINKAPANSFNFIIQLKIVFYNTRQIILNCIVWNKYIFSL